MRKSSHRRSTWATCTSGGLTKRQIRRLPQNTPMQRMIRSYLKYELVANSWLTRYYGR